MRPSPKTPKEWAEVLDQNVRNYIAEYKITFRKTTEHDRKLAATIKAYRSGWNSRHALSSKKERGEM